MCCHTRIQVSYDIIRLQLFLQQHHVEKHTRLHSPQNPVLFSFLHRLITMTDSSDTPSHQNNHIPIVPPRTGSNTTAVADISSSELLCRRCKTIDWANLLTTSSNISDGLGNTTYGTRILRIFTASRDQLVVSGCRVCRLAGYLKDPDPRFDRCRLEICENRSSEHSFDNGIFRGNKMAIRSMSGSKPCLPGSNLPNTVRYLIAQPFSQPAPYVAEIEPHSVNFRYFKKIAQNCHESHEKCRSTVGWASGLHLIDVKTRQIVKAEAGWRYVALSYVWGKDPPSQEDGSFTSVVEDAILATKELGCRYLWVDRHVSFHRSPLTRQFLSFPKC